MKYPSSPRQTVSRVLAPLAWLVLILPQARAVSTDPLAPADRDRDKNPRQARAEQLEKQGRWADACRIYEEMLRHDRGRADLRQHYLDCYRHYRQVYRHRDRSYRDVLALKYSETLRLYRTILTDLRKYHVEGAHVTPNQMFQRGLEEFRFGLDHGILTRYTHDAQGKPLPLGALQEFANRLRRYTIRPIYTADEAVRLVQEIALLAQGLPASGGLGMSPMVVVLEFCCGACTTLDQYTFYLTPRQFRSLTAALRGSKVGVGVELTMKDDAMIVAQVHPGSPAAEEGLKVYDQVLRIGKKLTAGLTPEMAMDLLRGESGTTVQLEIISAGMGMPRPVTLIRRKLLVRSVASAMLYQQKDGMGMATEKTDVGYIQILNFQDTTPQELDTALMELKAEGIKAVILDLRGNTGGSFEAAVDCARRFLSSGVIVEIRGADNKPVKHRVRNGTMLVPVMLPLVVLVDGDTASAAEVLAGALKDNGRAKLVGQTTYGKGCSQKLLQLLAGKGNDRLVGAIRVTVAKFFSPTGQPYNGIGITPDRFAERQDSGGTEDNQLLQAKKLLAEEMRMNN